MGKPSSSTHGIKKQSLAKGERSDVVFPDASVLQSSTISGSTDAFSWAKRFAHRAQSAGLLMSHTGWVHVCTEFSGSGCAEAALQSVVNSVNKGCDICFKYAADIDPSCRRVLMDTR